jgi:hypothetical protein
LRGRMFAREAMKRNQSPHVNAKVRAKNTRSWWRLNQETIGEADSASRGSDGANEAVFCFMRWKTYLNGQYEEHVFHCLPLLAE